MAKQTPEQAKAAALAAADTLETELMEIANGERKAGRISVPAIIRLIQYARTGTTSPATVKGVDHG